MNIIPHSRRYLSHTIDTRYFSVKLYRSGFTVNFVCRKYHISKASLMRWNKRFDGSRQSLADGSHRPLSPHPTAHTPLERKGITDKRQQPKEYYLHPARTQGDHRLVPSQSPYLLMRDVRQTSVSKGLLQASRISLPNIPGFRFFFQGFVNQEETEAYAVRYANTLGREMADGCKACSKSLLCRENT